MVKAGKHTQRNPTELLSIFRVSLEYVSDRTIEFCTSRFDSCRSRMNALKNGVTRESEQASRIPQDSQERRPFRECDEVQVRVQCRLTSILTS